MTSGLIDGILASRKPKIAGLIDRICDAIRAVGNVRDAAKIVVSVFVYDRSGTVIGQESFTLDISTGKVLGKRKRQTRKPKVAVADA